ncbi:GlxA family transcriptional regulator [Pararcticibacter amylolyticus]|uniref:AraC family transcriptional regulator n=1 Tax=Pararcticibacter amylolyticus TaxID=2173175 RepID=A0A2U2PG69_9SPHI|nr:GlxA family transcriptional regulator [Pararcticibacter amylolyticus]PWG80324.1 AraC family transcriptional regulator [Pararcticibacter amylolyticus]
MNQDDLFIAEDNPQKQIVIVAMTGHMLLDFAGPADVFNCANRALELRGRTDGYRVLVASPNANKQVTNSAGIEITCTYSVMEVSGPIDTLLIAGSNDVQNLDDPAYQDFYHWLSAVDQHTRRVGSVCAGAFALAKAGLLNGKRATTHWDRSRQLQKNYPLIQVDPNPFYTRDGKIYTSGGVSSGIDLALALVEEDHGKEIAMQVARRLVFYLNRPGFQVQFGNLLPVYDHQNIAEKIRSWMIGHLHEPLDVVRLADHMNMSPRNFTRVFHKQTGIPPAKYVEKLRVEAARKYLEDTDSSLEEIAERCGLGGLVSMRRTFLRHLMVTPSDYRRAFRTSLADVIT